MTNLVPLTTLAMSCSMSVDEMLDVAMSTRAQIQRIEGMFWVNPEDFEYLNQAEEIFLLGPMRKKSSSMRIPGSR